jgi:hypothetical protein
MSRTLPTLLDHLRRSPWLHPERVGDDDLLARYVRSRD